MNLTRIVTPLKKHIFTTTCGIITLLAVVVIWLRYASISEDEALLLAKNDEANRLRINITNSANLKEQLEQLTQLNNQVWSRMIVSGEVALNQQFFYKLESDSGVKLTDLRQSNAQTTATTATKGPFEVITYSIAVQGSYGQVIDFVRRLKNNDRLCRIAKASITGGSLDSSEKNTGLIVSLTVEFLGKL